MVATETQLFPLKREFIKTSEDGSGKGLFYFHQKGDFIKGILCGTQKRETLHYSYKTYLIKIWEGRQDGVDLLVVKDNQVIEFPANMKMRRIIEDHELIGSLVRIVFNGKRGRYKLYKVFKDTGTFYESEEKKHARSRKPKAGRKAGTKAGAGKKQLDKAARDDRSSRGPGGGQA